MTSHRRRTLWSAILSLVLMAGAVALAPASAAEESLEPSECTTLVTFTKYQKELTPAVDAVYQDQYRFLRLKNWKIEEAYFPLPDSSLEAAFWAAIDLLFSEGWVFAFEDPIPVEVSPAVDATYEYKFFAEEPAEEGWVATEETEDRPVKIPCPCPEGTIGETMPDCEPIDPCELEQAPIEECSDPCDSLQIQSDDCSDSDIPEDSTPDTTPDTTPDEIIVDTDPDPDPEPEPEPEVESLVEEPAVAGADAGVSAGGATLPRTGASSLSMLLMAMGLVGSGVSLTRLARRDD